VHLPDRGPAAHPRVYAGALETLEARRVGEGVNERASGAEAIRASRARAARAFALEGARAPRSPLPRADGVVGQTSPADVDARAPAPPWPDRGRRPRPRPPPV